MLSTGVPERKNFAETRLQGPESVYHSPVVLARESGGKDFSTPNAPHTTTLYPPRPVPALKIVKRSRAADQQKAGTTNIPAASDSSRRFSIVTGVMPRLRTGRQQSSEDKSPVTTSNGIKKRGQTTSVAAKPNGSQSGDGPRRVLVSDGPKVVITAKAQDAAQVKPVPPVDGPRRVRAPSRPNLATAGSIKQPPKYTTVGSAAAAASSIPKPISRNAGSRIPAPSNSRQRFGVQADGPSKGLLSGRTT